MNDLCPFCSKEIDPKDIFCPHCGNKIPQNTYGFTTGQLIKIYTITVLLCPFGLFWFFKHFRDTDPKKKKTAYIVLVLTLIFIGVMIGLTYYAQKSLNSIYEQSLYL